MFVGIAIADAFGSGYENLSEEETYKLTKIVAYRQNPKHTSLQPGHYTDDTQMSIALMELLLSDKPLTYLNLANAFVSTFKRDPRPGYAAGFYNILQEVKKGSDLLARLRPFSRRSGGAMRASPAGLLKEPADVVDVAMWQASLTHATKEGMDAAAAAALMVWACRKGMDMGDIPSFLLKLVPGYPWFGFWEGRVENEGIPCVRAALTALVCGSSMSDILLRCVNYTGDVDTVATIAVAAASWHPDMKEDLPQVLFDTLENGPYGLDYLRNLDNIVFQWLTR